MNMNRRALLVLILGSLAMPGISGCFFFDGGAWAPPRAEPDWWSPDTRVPEPYNDGSLLVHSSAQFGDMGDILEFAGDAVVSNASYYGRGASLRLDSVGSDWWVMSYLTIDNFDIVNAEAGTYSLTSAEWSGTEPYVSVTGCSGPTYGNYTFDQNTSNVELTLTDNEDGTRTLDFLVHYTTYDGRAQDATGSLVFSQGSYNQPNYYDPTPIIATDLAQDGTMGAIAGYSSLAEATSGYYYGTYSSIRLDSIGSGWWVMSALNVGNLDLANAPAGTYRTVSGVYDDPNDPQLSVTGCSGPSYGNYTFDAPSDETEVVIRDNEDGSRSLELTAVFSYSGSRQVARARFNYLVDSAGSVRY